MITSILSLMVAPILQADIKSGVEVGGSMGAFDPYHVGGPDKGSVTCPT